MQMLKGNIKVGVYQLQQGTRQLLCRLREQQKPYKENSSKESFSAALMFGLSQSLNFGRVYMFPLFQPAIQALTSKQPCKTHKVLSVSQKRKNTPK